LPTRVIWASFMIWAFLLFWVFGFAPVFGGLLPSRRGGVAQGTACSRVAQPSRSDGKTFSGQEARGGGWVVPLS
jgi:hypothetical protein